MAAHLSVTRLDATNGPGRSPFQGDASLPRDPVIRLVRREAPVSDVRKPRRWPWGVLVVLALSVGGPIAWRFRPLNAIEKTLVGRWQLLADGSAYELDARRRYLHPGTGGRGSWSASQGRIVFRSDLLGSIAAQS